MKNISNGQWSGDVIHIVQYMLAKSRDLTMTSLASPKFVNDVIRPCSLPTNMNDKHTHVHVEYLHACYKILLRGYSNVFAL